MMYTHAKDSKINKELNTYAVYKPLKKKADYDIRTTSLYLITH